MWARIQVPERSMSLVYEDHRWKEKFAINIRHVDTAEILRFRTREEAEEATRAFEQQGYAVESPAPSEDILVYLVWQYSSDSEYDDSIMYRDARFIEGIYLTQEDAEKHAVLTGGEVEPREIWSFDPARFTKAGSLRVKFRHDQG